MQFDVKLAFDSLDHTILRSLISKLGLGKGFDDLLNKFLKAGYMYGEIFQSPGDMGVPQRSLLGPILCNLYLHELDVYMSNIMDKYNKGRKRKSNPQYTKLTRGKGGSEIARARNISPLVISDPNFIRIGYVRYADDFILGVDGPKALAVSISNGIVNFLSGLKLEVKNFQVVCLLKNHLNFLGIRFNKVRRKHKPVRQTLKSLSTISPRLQVSYDGKRLNDKLIRAGFIRYINGKPHPTKVGRLIHHDPASIVLYFNSVFRGIANYYSIISNIHSIRELHYFIQYSLCLTLCSKFRLGTKRKTFKKFGLELRVKDNISFVGWDS